MLSSLINSSSSVIKFPIEKTEYSLCDLVDKGAKHYGTFLRKKGSWYICEMDNTSSTVSSLLWALVSEHDVLVTSKDLPDSVKENIEDKLLADTSGFQSMPRIALLTSGTTGYPKIVLHDALRIYNKCMLNDLYIYSKLNIKNVLCPLSLSFGHGLIGNFLSALISSQSISVLPNNLLSISSIPSMVKSFDIDFLSSVPSMWKVVKLKHGSLDGVNVGVGSSYLPRYLAQKFLDCGASCVLNFYGLTEMSNWIGFNKTNNRSAESLYDKNGNALFRLYPNTYSNIINCSNDSPAGELTLKHETMLLGYLGTLYPCGADNHYLTSDIFERTNKSDLLAMIGRDKFYVKRYGHRIHMSQIDSMISSLNIGIQSFTVNINRDQDEAYITTLLESTDQTFMKTIPSLLSNILQSTHLPDRYLLIDEIPKTQRGKIDYSKCVDYCSQS